MWFLSNTGPRKNNSIVQTQNISILNYIKDKDKDKDILSTYKKGCFMSFIRNEWHQRWEMRKNIFFMDVDFTIHKLT